MNIERTKRAITKIRDYFLSHDRTTFEHWAYAFLNELPLELEESKRESYTEDEVIQIIGEVAHHVRHSGYGYSSISSHFAKVWWEERKLNKEQKAHGSVATEAKLIDNSLDNNHLEEKKEPNY